VACDPGTGDRSQNLQGHEVLPDCAAEAGVRSRRVALVADAAGERGTRESSGAVGYHEA